MMGRVDESSSRKADQADNILPDNQKPQMPSSSSSSPPEGATNWSPYFMYGTTVKDEPMDDNRNDSGVTSESDPSGSPGSDRSVISPGISHPSTSTGMYAFNPAKTDVQYPWFRTHRIPPPSGEGPSSSPDNQTGNCADTQTSPTDENSNDCCQFNDDINQPKVNSHGRMKLQKCRQCDFFTYTKREFWRHNKQHLKEDRCLECPKCPFVTEYKHHLEYHLLNHAGAKPFKCPHCDYSCVNKSMLNSHLKSHSKVYQYRCADCTYETKYCHSLKLHLRKYSHQPDVVLNPDGTPNPYPVIDVYGTRRGPKVKRVDPNAAMPSAAPAPQAQGSEPQALVQPPAQPLVQPLAQPLPQPLLQPQPQPLAQPQQQMNMFNPMLGNPGPILPFPLLPFGGFAPTVPPEAMLAYLKERFEQIGQATQAMQMQIPAPVPEPAQPEALDLTQKSSESSLNGESDNEGEMTTVFSNVEVVENPPESRNESENSSSEAGNTSGQFICRHCDIIYPDELMYRVHMGFHGFNDPLTCNMCGEQFRDKYNFFTHIARVAH